MKVHIEFELPRWSKRVIAIGAPFVVLGLLAVVVVAAPKQWTGGDPLKAVDLNGLNVLDAGANGVYSVGATTFCNASSPTVGAAGGYPAMKALCQTACGSSTAHVCSPEEVSRSLQLGLEHTKLPSTLPAWYWISTGAVSTASGSTNLADCDGWRNNNAAGAQLTIDSNGHAYPGFGTCSPMIPAACCD